MYELRRSCAWVEKNPQTGDVLMQTEQTFGDGTKIDDSILEALIAVSHTFSTALQWQAGDVALVDNFRVMHGRYPYAGKSPRQIIVNLAR